MTHFNIVTVGIPYIIVLPFDKSEVIPDKT